MKSLDAISGAQQNHEPACSGGCQTATDIDGSLTKAVTRFMGTPQFQNWGRIETHEPARVCVGREALGVRRPARDSSELSAAFTSFGRERKSADQSAHSKTWRQVPRFIDGGTLSDRTRALPLRLAGDTDMDFYHQAVWAWKAPVEIVGDEEMAPLFTAWARARINPLDPGAAIRPAFSARLRTERLTAWWRKYEAAPNQKLWKIDVPVTQGW